MELGEKMTLEENWKLRADRVNAKAQPGVLISLIIRHLVNETIEFMADVAKRAEEINATKSQDTILRHRD